MKTKTTDEVLKHFIVFEGLDGAGTTTQSSLLADALRKRTASVQLTCEPTSSPTGHLIRSFLSSETTVPARTIALLFAADRDNHLNNTKGGIRTMLHSGDIVISDRYFFSSLAYQSVGVPFEEVESYNSTFPYPHIVIYLDTPPGVCMERLSERTSRDWYETIDFQEKVYRSYERAVSSLPSECSLLRYDGTRGISDISEDVLRDVLQIISIASP